MQARASRSQRPNTVFGGQPVEPGGQAHHHFTDPNHDVTEQDMPLRNTDRHYGDVTKGFHWLTALLIVSAIALGLFGEYAPRQSEAEIARLATAYSIHKTIGIAAFAVALLRIIWALFNPRPGLLHPERRMETFLAQLVHWMLYGALLLVPLSGWLHHAATDGFAPILWPFGQSLPLVPKSPQIAHLFEVWHWTFTRILFLALFLHVAGAVKHHVIDRDATLRRMLRGAPKIDGALGRHRPVPLLAAAAIWLGAIAYGSLPADETVSDTGELAAAALPAPASQWSVTQGQLDIVVQQFGSEVQGSFGDWAAVIDYDPETGNGSVTVEIAVGSLTLGSVTSEALGAEYLDAAGSPLATFRADIERIDGAEHLARGSLTLRGETAALDLPFSLTLDGDTASMTGSTTVNRMDHRVGAVQPSEQNLGFDVAVKVRLSATRAP